MMKAYARWLVCGMVVLGFMFVVCGPAVAENNKKLNEETQLVTPPPGNQGIAFASGSVATLDATGRVLSGTLARDTRLPTRPSGNGAVEFKGGTSIFFDEGGYVKYGDLAKDTRLNVPVPGGAADFKAGTMAWFDKRGYVSAGTLAQDTNLGMSSGGAKLFPSGTKVSFTTRGLVFTGAPDPSVAPKDPLNDSSWRVNNHPVPWVFHANGTVEAPGLWKGTWTKSGNDYAVTLTHQGATDSFTVKFNPDGQAFTAYKGGSAYRNGVRIK